MTLLVLLAALLIAFAVRRFAFGYPRPAHRYARLAPREIAFVRAAIDAMFPARGAIPVAGSDVDAPRYFDGLLDALHPGRRRLVRLLLCFFEQATVIWWAPSPRGWRRFSSLSLEQRIAVLEDWNDSRLFARRLVFTALRALLGMAYLGNPAVMRFLRVAPYDFPSPVLLPDLLYPPIGRDYDAIPYGPQDLTALSDGTPIPLDSPIHPDYAEEPL